jgi:hypothetical protein
VKPRVPTIVLALLISILSAGCFSFFGSSEPEESAAVTVVNDLDPPDTRTILIRPRGEDEERLGTVAGGDERELTYESTDLQGAYQLMARQSSGAALVSREFTLFAGARVRWEMRTNSVTVSQSP